MRIFSPRSLSQHCRHCSLGQILLTMKLIQRSINRHFILTASLAQITYSEATIQRAELALRCSPFHIKLLQDMRYQGISIYKTVANSGIELGYTKRKMSELVAESDLVWLIQVGMLRREVDGQGLTDSFRLTPLGWKVVERAEHQTLKPAGKRDRLKNFTRRWLGSLT
jgi:hypothetical protein